MSLLAVPSARRSRGVRASHALAHAQDERVFIGVLWVEALGRFLGEVILLIVRFVMVGLVTLFATSLTWEFSYREPGDGFPWAAYLAFWIGAAIWVLPILRYRRRVRRGWHATWEDHA